MKKKKKKSTLMSLSLLISALLAKADLDKTSSKKVRMHLQQKFQCDFTERKKEIDEMIMKFVDSQNSSASSSSDEEEDQKEKIETKIKSPPKRQATKKRKANSSENESNGNDSGDNYRPERAVKKKATKTTKKETTKKTGTGRKGTGFTRPYQLSPQLAAVVGSDCLPRHEVVKRVWAIINERNLYDPKNKQFAICDDQLKNLMGVKRFRTFAMLKYLKTHFLG